MNNNINEGRTIEYQEDIKLIIKKEMFVELKKCVQEASPNEACGIIFGEIAQVPNDALENDYFYYYTANKFSCIKSDKSSTVSFLIENIELLHQTIIKAMEELSIKKKTRLISIFHSHPSGNYPSTTDIKNMRLLNNFSDNDHRFISKAFKNLIWIIMDSNSFDLNGYIYLNSHLYQINIQIKE